MEDKRANIFLAVLTGLGVVVLAAYLPDWHVLLVQVAIFVVAMYCAYKAPLLARVLSAWFKSPKRGNVYLSSDLPNFKNYICDLIITNYEWRKKYITIDETAVWFEGRKILERHNSVPLKKWASKTISFITFKKKVSGFSIKDTNLWFTEGKHKFAVSISLSEPGTRNQFEAWFSITVNYSFPHHFFIQVAPSSKAAAEHHVHPTAGTGAA